MPSTRRVRYLQGWPDDMWQGQSSFRGSVPKLQLVACELNRVWDSTKRDNMVSRGRGMKQTNRFPSGSTDNDMDLVCLEGDVETSADSAV